MEQVVSTCTDTLVLCYELSTTEAARASTRTLSLAERAIVEDLSSLFASRRLTTNMTFVQYISAVLRAYKSARGTVSDWKSEVPGLFDRVCLLIARYGEGPVLTLMGHAYNPTGKRGGRHVMNLDSGGLPLPGPGRIKALQSTQIIPLADLVDPCELLRFISVVSSAAHELFTAGQRRAASISTSSNSAVAAASDAVSPSEVCFNYVTGNFALEGVGDLTVDSELNGIAKRLRATQVVITERKGSSSTYIIAVTTGADASPIAPGLAVDTSVTPPTIVGGVSGTTLSLADVRQWTSMSMTEMTKLTPALGRNINAFSLCSLGGSHNCIVGVSVFATANTDDTRDELRAHLNLISACSECLLAGSACSSHCPVCRLTGVVCARCRSVGIPEDAQEAFRRPCFSCAAKQLRCVRPVSVLATTDGASEQTAFKARHMQLVHEAARVRLAFVARKALLERTLARSQISWPPRTLLLPPLQVLPLCSVLSTF